VCPAPAVVRVSDSRLHEIPILERNPELFLPFYQEATMLNIGLWFNIRSARLGLAMARKTGSRSQNVRTGRDRFVSAWTKFPLFEQQRAAN
jgi:hypothetical protein